LLKLKRNNTLEKSSQKLVLLLYFSKKNAQRPIGENSSNLVTLIATNKHMIEKSVTAVAVSLF
jgi:hypothetical protein